MKKVLENLIKKYGTEDVFNRVSLEAFKEDVSKEVNSYIKGSSSPAEGALSRVFLRKVKNMGSKNEVLFYISETMFNLSGMS